MNDSNSKQEKGEDKFDLRGFFSVILAFSMAFCLIVWSHFASSLIRPQLLKRNYSQEQIEKENLTVTWTRNQI